MADQHLITMEARRTRIMGGHARARGSRFTVDSETEAEALEIAGDARRLSAPPAVPATARTEAERFVDPDPGDETEHL